MLFQINITRGRSRVDHWEGIAFLKKHWCCAMQVIWVRLKNKATTDAVWCPVSNTEFL